MERHRNHCANSVGRSGGTRLKRWWKAEDGLRSRLRYSGVASALGRLRLLFVGSFHVQSPLPRVFLQQCRVPRFGLVFVWVQYEAVSLRWAPMSIFFPSPLARRTLLVCFILFAGSSGATVLGTVWDRAGTCLVRILLSSSTASDPHSLDRFFSPSAIPLLARRHMASLGQSHLQEPPASTA